MSQRIDIDSLSNEQKRALLLHLNEFFNALNTMNNRFLVRLAGVDDASETVINLANEWSAAMNHVTGQSDAYVDKLLNPGSHKLN